jgi:hypothetical protein
MVPYAISNFANDGFIVVFSEDAENWKLSGVGRLKGRGYNLYLTIQILP